MSVHDSFSLTDLENLIAMDSRSVINVGSGNSAAVTLPSVDDIDPTDNSIDVKITVYENDEEIIIKGYISKDDGFDVSIEDIGKIIAIDTRSLMSLGQSAAISIPSVDDLDIDPSDENLEATVTVREKDGEIIVTARISCQS